MRRPTLDEVFVHLTGSGSAMPANSSQPAEEAVA